MNRLQKKCMMASGGLHVLLVLILFLGPAFLPKKPEAPTVEVLEILPVDPKMTDGRTHGGSGQPAVAESKPEQQPQAAQPQPTPPPPAPQPQPQPPQREEAKEEVKEVEPPKAKPQPEPVEKDDPDDFVIKTVKKPEKTPTKATSSSTTKKPSSSSKIEFSSVIKSPRTSTTSRTTTRSDAVADSRAKALQDLAKAIGGARSNIGSRTRGGTTVEFPGGDGSGGPVYVNYMQYVISAFDRAWIDPTDVDDERATVKTEIVVSRSGEIVSAKITSKSGISSLDRSVLRAINGVGKLPAFPEGARDSQRTFIINFNLKSKRAIG